MTNPNSAPDADVLVVERTGGVARVTLNRPAVHNAFNGALLEALGAAFADLSSDSTVRVIVLAGAGRSFCAGADLAWMRGMVALDELANRAGALRMARMFRAIDACPKPVVARVQGAAIGGGCGLVSAADIVVCGPRARFQLSEVRLGMAPAVISPFVVRKIGSSRARRLFLTGERIRPDVAERWGLVHEVVAEEEALDAAVQQIVDHLLKGGPEALAVCKTLAREADLWPEPDERTSALIAGLRASDEGQEGMRAFLEKRAPRWVDGGEA